MKRSFIYALYFLLLSLSQISCDDFLRENPRDRIGEEEAYRNLPELYLNAVASLYNHIGGYSDSQGLQGTGRGIYDLNTFTTDEAIMPTRGGDWYDGGFCKDFICTIGVSIMMPYRQLGSICIR